MSKHRVALGLLFAVAVSGPVAEARVPTFAVTSKDGLVTIGAPQTEGWECIEHATPNPYPTSFMRCRRKAAGEFFLLTAKQYQVAKEDQKTVDELANKVFPQDYKTFYATYQITGTALVSHQGLSGIELRVDAVHSVKGELRKVEQIFTQGRNVFVLTAEGARNQFGSWKAVIDDWMAGARFKAITGGSESTPPSAKPAAAPPGAANTGSSEASPPPNKPAAAPPG